LSRCVSQVHPFSPTAIDFTSHVLIFIDRQYYLFAFAPWAQRIWTPAPYAAPCSCSHSTGRSQAAQQNFGLEHISSRRCIDCGVPHVSGASLGRAGRATSAPRPRRAVHRVTHDPAATSAGSSCDRRFWPSIGSHLICHSYRPGTLGLT
jgi:hypothetical protein